MKQYEAELDGRQYALLEKMLSHENAQRLAMDQPIRGRDLFSDMTEDIYAPVEDGWSTLEIVLQESEEKLALLRKLTAAVFPEDAERFVRQLGNDDPDCPDNFEIRIRLRF